jgi:aspartate racemase
MEDMAKYYIKEIRKVQPEGQYYLAGYCLGAIISFEMAQQLTKQGEKIALLANFNGITPFYQRPENLNIDSNGTQASLYKQLQYYWNNVEELSLKHKLIYMLKKLKAVVVHKIRTWYFTFLYIVYRVISNMYNIAGRAQPKNIAKSYTGLSLYKMERKYKLKPYKGSMIIFRSPRIFSTPHLGWKTLVEGGIKTINIPGEHKGRRDIMNEPHVKSLAKELKVFLK